MFSSQAYLLSNPTNVKMITLPQKRNTCKKSKEKQVCKLLQTPKKIEDNI